MAYAKRSLKKKTTKKRSSMKRKAPKARVTSRGRAQSGAEHRMTGYARALRDPKDGPLVGVPQFVPIDTHRARVRAVGTIQTAGNDSARIFFNPARMVARDSYPIRYATGTGTAALGSEVGTQSFNSNAQQTAADFQASVAGGAIVNADGVKARVVGAMIRVCNVSAATTRGGVFTALHEPHHKTLEDFTLDDLSKNTKSIIRPAGDGGYITLLYRPVKPEEVEDWQLDAYSVPGQVQRTGFGPAGTTGNVDVDDGSVNDAFPGYMCIDYQGATGTTLHVEAYAIVEYAGESLTTLSRPIGAGGGKNAEPKHIRPSANDADGTEQQQGTSGCEVMTRARGLAQCDVGLGPAQQHADQLANVHEKDPPQVIRETRYSIVIENPDGTHDVYFKGTAAPGTKGSLREWEEDRVAGFGFHVKAWDEELQYFEDTYGYESDKVHYSGFSRGGGFAQYMGGTGYGSGHFHQYPPREGSTNAQSDEDWHDSHSALNSWLHDKLIEPGSQTVDDAMTSMEDLLPEQLFAWNY